MQIYLGGAALSAFRKAKLLHRLQVFDASIQDIEAEYVHFVDVGHTLSVGEEKALKQLLTYGSPFRGHRTGTLYVVVPRLGTISPWSSKATDIVHNCGVKHVNRLERGIAYYIRGGQAGAGYKAAIAENLHDRMTETVLKKLNEVERLFQVAQPVTFEPVNMLKAGQTALRTANQAMGLALSDDEIDYLHQSYQDLGRNLSDVELMMFAQVNSEHCRHKIFNATWRIDGATQPKSLFQMIKNTYAAHQEGVLSAYTDNAAVLEGPIAKRFFSDADDHTYRYHQESVHLVIKAETHNHPTAIAPAPGAATGVGGEIRDGASVGRGSKSKAGMSGYSVSNLHIPEAPQAWEQSYGKPHHIASALDIMLDAPIGAAGYCNEFGRPALGGYFRTYEAVADGQVFGYHKPIMLAAGLGNIREEHTHKQTLPAGSLIILIGGPALLIGLGGSAASSMQAGTSLEALDFASVQRGNAEMERRDQEVIDACWSLGEKNPIISIQDIGGGGLSTALPEFVHDSNRGAVVELREVLSDEPGLSPLEIWCNEAQERYVLAIAPKDLDRFRAICQRERCPFAVVGHVTKAEQLVVNDQLFKNRPVDVPLSLLFGRPPKMIREFKPQKNMLSPLRLGSINVEEAIKRVLHVPAVGSKKFLITIGDRCVSGLVVRDQMVGPWQVPVADVSVTAATMTSETGEAMAIGERPPLALIDAAASARIAVAEAVTNIVAADVEQLTDIKLSANWMAAAGAQGQDEKLFEAVKTIGEDFCPELGLTIPVGKDSLSMRTTWQADDGPKSVTAPLSLVISAFAPVTACERTLTPQLSTAEESSLILIDLGEGKQRLGGSALAQAYNQIGHESPDIAPDLLKRFFTAITELKQQNAILAYHDRSDGGLLSTVCEMAFAARAGLDIVLDDLPGETLAKLFSEELGAVIQVRAADSQRLTQLLRRQITEHVYAIGRPTKPQTIRFQDSGKTVYEASRTQLESWWGATSYHLQKMRDNPTCAKQEFTAIQDDKDPGLTPSVNFTPTTKRYRTKPKVAVLREVGLNGHIEMAAAFDRAGFEAVDVHLNDIINGLVRLPDFKGLAIAGGFSYGDVLGAGGGWAKSILLNTNLTRDFREFFAREDSFSLGTCNGCQLLVRLKTLIPGAKLWPALSKNTSEQFEARLSLVRINQSSSIFFRDMAGSVLPVPVAHGEGRAEFKSAAVRQQNLDRQLVCLQYVDNYGQASDQYPANPNGSPFGITALTTPDGRATVMMPHPERAFLTRQLSWHPAEWGVDSPWMQMFYNARAWVG